MQQATTRSDHEFGLMTFTNNQWELERHATLGDQTVPVYVEPDELSTQDLSAVQREAVRQALALPADVLDTTAPIVIQNYDVYREALGDDELPPLSDPAHIWDEVTFSYMFVPPHADGAAQVPSFLLFAECSWDPEHGLVVRFRNGIADEADQQGDLYI